MSVVQVAAIEIDVRQMVQVDAYGSSEWQRVSDGTRSRLVGPSVDTSVIPDTSHARHACASCEKEFGKIPPSTFRARRL
jgi:hypothetical protein